MKAKFRPSLLLCLTIFLVSCDGNHLEKGELFSIKDSPPVLNSASYKEKTEESFNFCKRNNYNTDFCILIDMERHSGLERFLVWDFTTNSIQHSFLVSHGCCNSPWANDKTKENPTFSNVPESHCSSLGKYKIGERGYSKWGVNIKYLLHGLEATNNNALRRVIVFHSWERVPDQEIYPKGTPEGWGCPAISNANFKIVDALLKSSSKPVLMYIF